LKLIGFAWFHFIKLPPSLWVIMQLPPPFASRLKWIGLDPVAQHKLKSCSLVNMLSLSAIIFSSKKFTAAPAFKRVKA